MSFTSFQLRPEIMAGIKASGYTTPTPIQEQALPAALKGLDLMGLAQTGTGKTAAFVLPILQRLGNGPRGKARALVLAPTRELAEQIQETFVLLGAKTGLRSVSIYGGVSKIGQIKKIRAGAEIIVACPGRLLDHMDCGDIRLDNVEILVLDEADQMFDMGFLPSIRRIIRAVPSKRQTMLFSATMPTDIRRLAKDILVDPALVQVDQDRPAATVSHALFPVAAHRKSALLLALLQETPTGCALVFTRTKHGAKNLARRLAAAGHKATDLQGNLSQNQRRAALDGFKQGEYTILVATDIAARGIDVSGISHVINYDMPNTPEAYTHRIGRTGRAERTGEAYSLVGREDFAMIGAIERGMGEKIERRQLESFDYNAGMEDADKDAAADSERPRRPAGYGRGSRSPGNAAHKGDRWPDSGDAARRPFKGPSRRPLSSRPGRNAN